MPSEDDRKLFVAGLPESITEDGVRQLFEEAGATVLDVSLPRDRATGRMRGFGFVTLGSAEQAASVRRALDGSMQSGRSISVRAFRTDGARREQNVGRSPDRERLGSDRTLYVGNLPYDCSEEELVELFDGSSAGPIVRVHLPAGADGRRRGYGFVTLGSAQAAGEAIEALRGAELRGRRLQVNLAQPRGERSDRGGPRGADRREGPVRGSASAAAASRPAAPPVNGAVDPAETPPPFPDEVARASGGRKRVERPERREKKKKRGKGREERAEGSQRRRGARRWDDWDED